MTIKYLAGNRVQGTRAERPTKRISFEERNGDYDEVIYKQLPTALGTDANFTLRFRLDLTTISQSGNDDSVRFVMGLDTVADVADSSTRDAVQMVWRVTDSINKFYAQTLDGIAPTSAYSGTDFATTPSTTGIYYVEIAHTDGATGTYTFKLYSDQNYSTLIESETVTDAGLTGLNYIVFRTWSLAAHNNQARGYIQRVRLNGAYTDSWITSNSDTLDTVTGSSESYANNTIFEETDTHKSYIWNATTKVWTEIT
jgi:hypothetical protein